MKSRSQQPKNYDIVVIRRKGFFGTAIRFFRSIARLRAVRVDHSGEYLNGRIVECRAVGKYKGVDNERLFDDFVKYCESGKWKMKILRNHNAPINRPERMHSMMGTNYGYINLVVFHVIRCFTGLWLGRRDTKTVVCSEFTAYNNGVKKFYKIAPDELLDQGWELIDEFGYD